MRQTIFHFFIISIFYSNGEVDGEDLYSIVPHLQFVVFSLPMLQIPTIWEDISDYNEFLVIGNTDENLYSFTEKINGSGLTSHQILNESERDVWILQEIESLCSPLIARGKL